MHFNLLARTIWLGFDSHWIKNEANTQPNDDEQQQKKWKHLIDARRVAAVVAHTCAAHRVLYHSTRGPHDGFFVVVGGDDAAHPSAQHPARNEFSFDFFFRFLNCTVAFFPRQN